MTKLLSLSSSTMQHRFSLQQDIPITETLTIENTGTQSVTISSVSADNENYTASVASSVLAGGGMQSASAMIHTNPSGTAYFSIIQLSETSHAGFAARVAGAYSAGVISEPQ